MSHMHVIGHHDGWLCVVYQSPSYMEPDLIRLWWPVCRMTEADMKDSALEIGAPVTDGGIDQPFYVDRGAGFGSLLSLPLKDGGTTKPIKSESVPIPAPKTKCETRYERGRWEKYLKAKGWVAA